jgi:hypothetical protein
MSCLKGFGIQNPNVKIQMPNEIATPNLQGNAALNKVDYRLSESRRSILQIIASRIAILGLIRHWDF